jgi:hypothetical protein
MTRFRRILAGAAALASLTLLLFLLLRWRTNSPEQHINLNGAEQGQPSEQDDE